MRPIGIRAIAIALALASTATAAASPSAAASGWIGISVEHVEPPAPRPSPPDVAAFDLRLRGLLGGNRAAWAPAMELRLGGGLDGGFAYGFDLLVAGFGIRLGGDGWIALATGGGLGGVTGSLAFAWELPVVLAAEVDLDEHVRLIARLRVAWATDRAVGAPSLPWVDEAQLLVGLRLGGRTEYGDAVAGSGYVIAASYGELLGAHTVGASVAFALSAGMF